MTCWNWRGKTWVLHHILIEFNLIYIYTYHFHANVSYFIGTQQKAMMLEIVNNIGVPANFFLWGFESMMKNYFTAHNTHHTLGFFSWLKNVVIPNYNKCSKLIFIKKCSVKMWCKTHVLPLQFQHTTSSHNIFNKKHNQTQSILILIYKSNQIGNLLRCY